MTECINVYCAMQSIARSMLSCGVRLSVCHVDVSKRLLSNFFVAWWPHHSSFFSKRRLDCEIPTRSPSTGAPKLIEVGYQKFAIFDQYFRKTDTETEDRYRPSSSIKLSATRTICGHVTSNHFCLYCFHEWFVNC